MCHAHYSIELLSVCTSQHTHIRGGGAGARATPAQPASGGGCLPQSRWAVCATGAGAHQGQTSCEGEKDIWWTARTARGGTRHLGLTHTETQRGRLRTACGQRRVDSKNSQTTPHQQPAHPQYAQLLGAACANGTPCHIQHSPNTPTTGLRERRNDTSKSTGRQKAATRRNMRREERVTVQGPIKERQPDGMSHMGGLRPIGYSRQPPLVKVGSPPPLDSGVCMWYLGLKHPRPLPTSPTLSSGWSPAPRQEPRLD